MSFQNRNDVKIGLRFGYLGLGMGGCSIAAKCADIKTSIQNEHYPYSALLINTNAGDFSKIETKNPNIKKYQLKGYERGAGRDINIGEKAFNEHKENITEEVKQHFAHSDFVWIVCGLGGGTGTGSILEAIKVLGNSGFQRRFGLIVTLPRDKEGSTVISNALSRIQKIAKAMNHLGSMILVDNQKLYNMYLEQFAEASISEYTNYANNYIADTLHEINVVTSSFTPNGDVHFDSSELLKNITVPGVLSISKLSKKDSEVDISNKQYLTSFEQSLKNGALSDNHQVETTKRAAVSVIANKPTAQRVFRLDFYNSIEDSLDKLAPSAAERPVATYTDDQANQITFYSILAGLSLPPRIVELIEENKRVEALRQQQEENNDVLNALNEFDTSQEETTKQQVDYDNLFDDNPDQTTSKNEEFDPFKGL